MHKQQDGLVLQSHWQGAIQHLLQQSKYMFSIVYAYHIHIYMTTVLNPLTCFHTGSWLYYWFRPGTRNRIHYRTFLVELQKAAIREVSGKRNGKEKRPRNRFLQNTAIREDPGSFREEKREERNRLSKNPQSGKIREVSGKRNGKRCEHCKSRFQSISIRVPTAPDFPKSGPCLNFMVKSGHTGRHK